MAAYFPNFFKASALLVLGILLAIFSEQTAQAWCNKIGKFCPNGVEATGNICLQNQCIVQQDVCACGTGMVGVATVQGTEEMYGCVTDTTSVDMVYVCGTGVGSTDSTTSTSTTTGTSSVASAVTSSTTTATSSMAVIATEMPESQAAAAKAAGDVSLIGANNKANGALLFCAEGANRELESSGTGVDDIATCQGDFAKADQLASMAARNGKDATLRRDDAMLNDAAALAALEKFEKNFGVNKDDYVSRMLNSHGKSAEFADMLSSKFNEEKLDKLFSAAAEAKPVEYTEVAAAATEPSASGVGKAKLNASLRDSLKAKLEAADANRRLASKEPPKTDYSTIKVGKERLQPAGLDSWISGSEQEQEASLTIFDVVHAKMQSLKQRERI